MNPGRRGKVVRCIECGVRFAKLPKKKCGPCRRWEEEDRATHTIYGP